MFKFALLLLLCTPAIRSHRPDLFRGCVPTSENPPNDTSRVHRGTDERTEHSRCVLHEARRVRCCRNPLTSCNRSFLNTVYNVTRAAVKYPGHLNVGATLRMEFLTARSGCLHRPYSVYVCPPCRREEATRHSKPKSSSVTSP
ncbi:hypothetical protein MRX96_001963 [Rhipicephalus microplus]